jgi:hypothetical protein
MSGCGRRMKTDVHCRVETYRLHDLFILNAAENKKGSGSAYGSRMPFAISIRTAALRIDILLGVRPLVGYTA